MKKNIVLKIAYAGQYFYGSQKQRDFYTVQGELERRLSGFLGEKIQTTFASRTDRGVHAVGNYASFSTESNIPAEKIYRLNRSLKHIRIRKVFTSSDDFSARHSARGKIYMYQIYTKKAKNPFIEDYFWHTGVTPDTELIKNSMEQFIGEHDFQAFSKKRDERENTVRTIYSIKMVTGSNTIRFFIRGNSFLYNQIRFMLYSLNEIGRRRLPPDYISYMLKNGSDSNRRLTGKALPGGLFLVNVFYDEPLNFIREEKNEQQDFSA